MVLVELEGAKGMTGAIKGVVVRVGPFVLAMKLAMKMRHVQYNPDAAVQLLMISDVEAVRRRGHIATIAVLLTSR